MRCKRVLTILKIRIVLYGDKNEVQREVVKLY